MCEFCTKHGEGKKWYLEMKNYADELLHQELSSDQKDVAGVQTRVEWVDRFIESFVMPAITGVPKDPSRTLRPHGDARLSEEEIIERRKFIHFGQVLPIEDVEEMVDKVDSITRWPCGCRFLNTGKTDKRYCFGFGVDKTGMLGRFPDASSSLEVLDKGEAKAIFRDYDEEGLVHSIWTGITPYVVGMCNCDRDCGAYKGYIGNNGTQSFFRAEYVGQTDWDLCTGCKSCMQQCQFGAISYSSALSKCHVDPAKCFGCGVCRTACPHDAISLLPREEHPEVAALW